MHSNKGFPTSTFCAPNWIAASKSKCFFLSGKVVASSWEDAENRCTKLRIGSTLASIEDHYELNVLLGKMKSYIKQTISLICRFNCNLDTLFYWGYTQGTWKKLEMGGWKSMDLGKGGKARQEERQLSRDEGDNQQSRYQLDCLGWSWVWQGSSKKLCMLLQKRWNL